MPDPTKATNDLYAAVSAISPNVCSLMPLSSCMASCTNSPAPPYIAILVIKGKSSKAVKVVPRRGTGFTKGLTNFANFFDPASISPNITPASSYTNSAKSDKNSFVPPLKKLESNLVKGSFGFLLNSISPLLYLLAGPSNICFGSSLPGTKYNSPSGYLALNSAIFSLRVSAAAILPLKSGSSKLPSPIGMSGSP